MPSRRRRRRLLPQGLLLAMLVGMVLLPAVLTLSVGIVALSVWRDAFDIVFGVLVLSFAAVALAGGVTAIGYVRRGAKLAERHADFVANISHELRTPLAGIRLVAETLEAGRGDDPERLAALTEMLGDEMRRLEDLVERVLAWRSLGGDIGDVEREPVAVAELVDEVVTSTRRLPEARNVTVAVKVDEDLPPVMGDRTALRHALHNLVHNAIKFGGAVGPVEVTAGPSDGSVWIAVRDRGPGVEPRDQKRIFERFYRGHAGSARGTGLGLDIVWSVVTAHGGWVEVESFAGEGAVFTLRLPASSQAKSTLGK